MLAVFTLAACGGDGDELAVTIRLGDLLGEATIESPLTEVAAAASVEELADVARATVLTEDFEEFDMAAARWSESPHGKIAVTGDGHCFELRELGKSRYGWVLPAEPGTHYVFSRRVRSEAPLHADFAVVESKDALDPREHKPSDVPGLELEADADGKQAVQFRSRIEGIAGSESALKIHWPGSPKTDGSWQSGSVSFFATPMTHSFTVIMRPKNLAESADAGRPIWFDDLRLERLSPTPRQVIALLKAKSPADDADAELGIEKFGQFPPLGDVGSVHSAADDNFSYRYALYAPPPTSLGFKVAMPANATLHFSISLSRETAPKHGARFSVHARSDGGEEELWSRTVVAAGADWRWHEVAVDLAGYGGREVDLVLRTRSTVGHPHPVWGNPVVVSGTSTPPRNVILIAVDTLRADRMSGYGYGQKTSPNIDALGRDGVRFDQVASQANWTCPSFASIFTGVVPSRHGVHSWGPNTPLPTEFETLAERFRAHGWATHSIVYKGPLYDGGFEQGFDVAFNVPRADPRAEDNLAEAMEWLETNAGRSNFLFLHFNDPHQPFNQPSPFDEAFGTHPSAFFINLPYKVQPLTTRDEWLRELCSQLYDGEISYVDDRIGEFLAALRERGLYERAVIAFVSDHGEALWDHGYFGHGPNFDVQAGSKGELKQIAGGADLLFDEVIRVPLIIKPAAGSHDRGSVIDTQVRCFDVMPTLLELAGIGVDGVMQARSLVPLMTGEETSDRTAVIESSGAAVAVRNTRWKYVLSYGGRRGRHEALFDLVNDPVEKRNVRRQNVEVLEQMRLQCLEYLLLHRPGQYAVAIGDGSFGLSGLAKVVSYFGLDARSADGSVTSEGAAEDGLAAVWRFEIDGEVSIAAGSVELHGSRRYQPGDLARLLEQLKPGVHLFEGPPSVASGHARATMDARQIEALRNLGYVDGGSEGR